MVAVALQHKTFTDFESVNRITNLPIVESGWNYAGFIYNKIKRSNNLLNWTFDHAESSFYNFVDNTTPAILIFDGPLTKIDQIICKSLDVVEQKVPLIHLPPQMIYSNTREYVDTRFVAPVLKRADSVKQIGNSVLASKYTLYAADKLDDALDVAEKYVDKYLPADQAETDYVYTKSADGSKALQASHHVIRFSKKLQRRLTRRTLLEAKALKEQSVEAIHVLVYVAELIAKDPKLALQKGRELWATLSRDEPENQARPENLEQLIVLLTRETARRVVHLVNFTAASLGSVPRQLTHAVGLITSTCGQILDSLLKAVRLDGIKEMIYIEIKKQFKILYHSINNLEQSHKITQTNHQEFIVPQTTVSVANSTPPPELNNANEEQENCNLNVKSKDNCNLRPPTVSKSELKAANCRPNNITNGDQQQKIE